MEVGGWRSEIRGQKLESQNKFEVSKVTKVVKNKEFIKRAGKEDSGI